MKGTPLQVPGTPNLPAPREETEAGPTFPSVSHYPKETHAGARQHEYLRIPNFPSSLLLSWKNWDPEIAVSRDRDGRTQADMHKSLARMHTQ